MRNTLVVALVLALLGIATLADAQVRATGTVQGRVIDVDGVALPGVRVYVTGENTRGEHTAFTGADGQFRIHLLLPGTYTLTFQLQGFAIIDREDVIVGVQRITIIDITMQLSAIEETITVTGRSPMVDIKSTKRSSDYSDELRNVLPESRGVGGDLMNLAPEATPGGGSSNASGANFFGENSTAYMVDGVNVTDPAGGSQFPFYSPDWFEVVELTSLGGGAEFGKYQGVAFNVVTKSGGNTFHGEANYFFQNDAFISDNTAAVNEDQCPLDYAAGEPEFEPPSLDYRHDFTLGVGGPLIRDKMWFFASYQGFYENEGAANVSYPVTEDSDRFFGKFTWQANQDNRLTASIMSDTYTLDGRPGSSLREWEQTGWEPSMNITPNITWNSVLNPDMFLEVKYSGFYGYFDLIPRNDVPSTFDGGYWFYFGGYLAHWAEDRSRTNIQGSLSYYVEDWGGDHSFKFGAEWERNGQTSSGQYNANLNTIEVLGQEYTPGTLGIYYYAYYGNPYYAYLYDPNQQQSVGTSVQEPFTVFVQDDWTVGDRVTLNLGIRYDHWKMGYKGGVTVPDTPVFNDVSPRLGVNFDIFGDGTTSINAFYGKYFEEAHGYAFWDFDPRRSSSYGLIWDGAGYNDVWYITDPLANIGIDPDLRNQYSEQFVVGFDRQITEDLAFTARYVHKKAHDIYGGEDIGTEYVPATAITDWGDPLQVYNAPLGFDYDFLYLTNNPWEELFGPSFREYDSVQFKAVKRLANNWSLIGSLMIQKSTGNNEATTGSLFNRASPNGFVNRPGELAASRRYVSKIQGSYRIPLPVDTQLGFIINWMSGGRQSAGERIRYFQVNGEDVRFGQSSITVPIEQIGSTVKGSQFRLDLRADKKLQLGGAWGDLGVVLDIFNVFNDDTISNIYTRVDGGVGTSYGDPSAIVRSRIFRLGVRWIF